MWTAGREGRRSRWGEEEGKKRAPGKDGGRMGVGGRKGGKKGREEEERAGRALFVVLWINHSGVIKKQERKETRLPGLEDWGAPRDTTPSSGLLLHCLLAWAQASPPTNGGPRSSPAGSLALTAQLPVPPQPCSSPPPPNSLTVRSHHLCLPRELQAVWGQFSPPPPQPAALFSFFL